MLRSSYAVLRLFVAFANFSVGHNPPLPDEHAALHQNHRLCSWAIGGDPRAAAPAIHEGLGVGLLICICSMEWAALCSVAGPPVFDRMFLSLPRSPVPCACFPFAALVAFDRLYCSLLAQPVAMIGMQIYFQLLDFSWYLSAQQAIGPLVCPSLSGLAGLAPSFCLRPR